MADPTVVRVTGEIREVDGDPFNGNILFTVPVHLRHNDGTLIMPGTLAAPVVDGLLDIEVYAVDDPEWLPVGWAYEVRIPRGSRTSVYLYQPGIDDLEETLNAIVPEDVPVLVPGAVYALANHTHEGGGSGGGSVAWADITGKPSTFPPSAHSQAISTVTGLQGALDAKADSASVSTALGLKANTASLSTVATTGAYADLSGKPALSAVAISGSYADLSSKPTIPSTKADVGLGNVDNTSDAAKPVSTAQLTALNLKAPLASPTFTGTVAGVTASMVGLGNVNNTSDANKPVSTSQQTALDAKQPIIKKWNGSAYVVATGAEVYVGAGTPSSPADGSLWFAS